MKEQLPEIRGSLFVWSAHWALIGYLPPNCTHQHVSASLLVGLSGPFRLEVQGRWWQTRAALVAPDVAQALDPCGQCMLVVQLDPDSDYWRALWRLTGGAPSVDLPSLDPSRLDLAPVAEWKEPGNLSCHLVRAQIDALVQEIGHGFQAMEPRVSQVCTALRESLPERLDVAALAEQVGLSASRLTHLFRSETGVSLRRFLLHLKLEQALTQWEPDMNFSDLAVKAGFYDQPHFVRTARRMFDALPSTYVASGKLKLVHCSCGAAVSE